MNVKITTSKKKSKTYGRISKIEFPKRGAIYISKKGWNVKTPNDTEVNISYDEIKIAMQETFELGYISREAV